MWDVLYLIYYTSGKTQDLQSFNSRLISLSATNNIVMDHLSVYDVSISHNSGDTQRRICLLTHEKMRYLLECHLLHKSRSLCFGK